MTDPLTPAPRLMTDRLRLRGPVRADLTVHTAFVTASPRLAAMNNLGTASDAWRGFVGGIGHWHWHGYGLFTLTLQDDDTPLGRVGLLNHQGWDDVEIAWHLYDGSEGRGYASEAAQTVRDWARATLNITCLVSYIDQANTRSQSVARRVGAATDGTRATHDPMAEIWVHQGGAS